VVVLELLEVLNTKRQVSTQYVRYYH